MQYCTKIWTESWEWGQPQLSTWWLSSSLSSYSLFAVVNHSGSLHNGHYTCYVRQQQDQVTTIMAVCWRHSTILNSYISQMEQHEPEGRMLICLGNVTYLLNVAPSNPLPHPLSPPPFSSKILLLGNIQQSRILHALYKKKMPPNNKIACQRTTALFQPGPCPITTTTSLLLYIFGGVSFTMILLHTWTINEPHLPCSGSNVMTPGSPRQQLKRC